MMKQQVFGMTTLVAVLFASFSVSHAITEDEKADILFMKQEEKLARDVYLALGDIWDQQVFSNIARSEQRHMDSVDYLIKTFELTDMTPAESGVFTYDELTSLYATLIEKGSATLIDALEVGVAIEEVDIADLEDALETTEDVTIRNIFGNLLRASYNHLEAFQSNLTAGIDGALAAPQIQFEKNSENQTCVVASEAGEGTQRQLQNKSSQNGNGNQWQAEQGNGNSTTGNNGNGTTGNNGNAGAQNQNATQNQNQITVDCDPENPTQLRLKDSNGNQVRYSNTLNTQLVDTPWPNAETLGRGWFATWMGDIYIVQYPTVYIERFGWIDIESFDNEEVVWKNEAGDRFMTTEAQYPSYFDYQLGEWK